MASERIILHLCLLYGREKEIVASSIAAAPWLVPNFSFCLHQKEVEYADLPVRWPVGSQ